MDYLKYNEQYANNVINLLNQQHLHLELTHFQQLKVL